MRAQTTRKNKRRQSTFRNQALARKADEIMVRALEVPTNIKTDFLQWQTWRHSFSLVVFARKFSRGARLTPPALRRSTP